MENRYKKSMLCSAKHAFDTLNAAPRIKVLAGGFGD